MNATHPACPRRHRPGHRGDDRPSASIRHAAPWLAACLLAAAPAFASPPDAAAPDPQHPPSVDAAPTPLAGEARNTGQVPGCNAGYADNDAALFDFIKTRRAVDYAALQGKVIRNIRYLTLPVFNSDDPKENNALYRGVNYLHILTRASAVQRQLLIRTGDPLDGDLVRESERILRGANYLYDAMILPERLCEDGIDLLVIVRDIWTLQPAVNYSRAGGQNHTSIGISEDNILGYGHALILSYDRSAERSGVVFGYNSRNLIDGHTHLQLDHAENDDGRAEHLRFERPFYALDTRRAGGIEVSDALRRDTATSSGIITNEYDHQARFLEAYAGVSSGLRENTVHRWRTGLTRQSDRYDGQVSGYSNPLPPDRLFVYPWLEYERLENDFVTTLNLSQLFRNEDINIGEGWRVRTGMTSKALGSTTDAVVIAAANYHNTVSFGAHHLLRNTASAGSYWHKDTGKYENTLLGYSTQYDYFIDDNDRWHATLSLDAGKNLNDENMLTAGGDFKLRGYPASWQRGNRRITGTLERRHFYRAHPLNLFRLGSALFLDAGRAWDSTDTIAQSDRILVDVGIGLRLNSSKARSNHVLHADIAFPLTDRGEADSVQISFHSSNAF